MKNVKRKVMEAALSDLKKKIVFIVGPRQVGKTWLAKEVMKFYKHPMYLNYDNSEHREVIKNYGWLPETDLVVFDEIHKMPKWKTHLKGIFDTKAENMHMLVTGSARMDAFRKAGDSLAGRFFIHHLLPFTLAELDSVYGGVSLDTLLERSGFPEPFLANDPDTANRWRISYTDSLLRQDVLDFQEIEKVNVIRLIYDILRTKVGSPISYSSIARDVGVSSATVKKYIEILEALYIIFIIKPYTHKITRSILKEPKIYFFDYGVISDHGARFENLVALALYAHTVIKTDTTGKRYNLGFLKTKENKEVDFAVYNEDNILDQIVEAKLGDNKLSTTLEYFVQKYKLKGVQVVKDLKLERVVNGVEIRKAEKYLKKLGV